MLVALQNKRLSKYKKQTFNIQRTQYMIAAKQVEQVKYNNTILINMHHHANDYKYKEESIDFPQLEN